MTSLGYRLISLLMLVNEGAAASSGCSTPSNTQACRREQLMAQELRLRNQFQYALAGEPLETRRVFQASHDQWVKERAEHCRLAESNRIDAWVDAANSSDRNAECVTQVTAERLAILDSIVATNSVRSRYRLHVGAGKPLCEDYWRSLTGFGSQEPPMVCAQKLHPDSRSLTPVAWKELLVKDNLQLVYSAILQLPPYKTGNQPPPSFKVWEKQFTEELQAGLRKPRLREATVELTPARPEILVSFEPDSAACATAPVVVTFTSHFFLRSPADPARLVPVVTAADVFQWNSTPVFVMSGWRDLDNFNLSLSVVAGDSSPFRRLDASPVLTEQCEFSTAK